jgi:hypothetical protein
MAGLQTENERICTVAGDYLDSGFELFPYESSDLVPSFQFRQNGVWVRANWRSPSQLPR